MYKLLCVSVLCILFIFYLAASSEKKMIGCKPVNDLQPNHFFTAQAVLAALQLASTDGDLEALIRDWSSCFGRLETRLKT